MEAQEPLTPAPWIAWRVFRTAEVTRCVISDELSHTYTELEGVSAEVWDHLARGATPPQVSELLPNAGLTADDVAEFERELAEMGLFYRAGSARGVEAKEVPTPVPLEEGANVPLENDMMHWAISQGFLWNCHWEITYRCNEACVHCYNPGAAHKKGDKPNRSRDELSTAEARLLLDRLVELGLFRLTISGGEAFLREDLMEIVAHARALGVSVDLYTNGLALSDERLDELAQYWPRSVSVSVYSDDAQEHDSITRVPGSFKKSVDCLQRLHDRGIKTAMKAVAFKQTVDRQVGLKSLAGSLGAALEIEGSLIHGQDGASAPQALGITDIVRLIQLSMDAESPFFVGTSDEHYGRRPKDREATVCGAGVSFLHIDPEGNIMPCSSLPLNFGNVREDDVREVWRENQRRQHEFDRVRDRANLLSSDSTQDVMEAWGSIRLRDYRECGTHERCNWCQKCPGKAMLEHGDPLAPSTVDCRMASARMWAANLLRAGVSAPDLDGLIGLYDTEPEMSVERPGRDALAAHAAGSMLDVIHSGNGCGSCGNAGFCGGGEVARVESEVGAEAAGVARATAGMLQAFDSLAKRYLLPMMNQ